MSGILNDVKVSLRQLRKTPGFSAAAILVLGLSIGLNAAMFGLSYTMIFEKLPAARPEALMQLYSHARNEPDAFRGFSWGAFRALAGRNDVFDGVLAHRILVTGVNEGTEGGMPRRTVSALISDNYFDVIGVSLARGRAFTEAESRPGAETPVAIASYAFWKRTGLDPGLLGGTVRVNGRPFTIVGITPKEFLGLNVLLGPEVYLPLGVFDSVENRPEKSSQRGLARSDRFPLVLLGRLKPGFSADSAAPALALAAAEVERAFPVEYKNQEFLARPAPRLEYSNRPPQDGAIATLAIAMLGMTGSVLLIVCLNLASLFMARGQARRREFAIRLAIGGGRARIVRQFVTEGLILSLIGGTLGAMLGVYAVDAMTAGVLDRMPFSLALDFSAPPALVAGTAVFSIIATLMFAFGPALRHSGQGVLSDLKQQAGDEGRPRRSRFLPRNPLVSAQIALSLSLLISAGLFLQMARQANVTDPGFEASSTVAIEVDAALGGYGDAESLSLYARIEDRLRTLPGARSSSIVAFIPFGMMNEGRYVRPAGSPEDKEGLGSRWNAVGASHFETMGVKVLRGRAFTEAEARNPETRRVAVINEVLARRLFPEGDPLGRSIEFQPAGSNAVEKGPLEVVGIVSATRDDPFDKGETNGVYVPFAQGYRANAWFQVRAQGPADALVDAVQREVRAVAPGLPAFKARTFEQHIAGSFASWALRVSTSLFVVLGLFASLIAVIGIYGSMSYAVARRTREFGIRLAIGATPARVRRLVIGEGLALAGVGVALGLLFGVGVGQVMDSIFVEVGAFDPATFILAPLLLLGASVGAAWLPARRATAVDPVTSLRAD
jgi:predicted permease